MYGAGIYFATDSSKSAREIYTKGSNKLLVCKVLLGKYKQVLGADTQLCLESLRKEGYDSVFAPRNSKGTSGVLNDEFVIYDCDQAKVDYIVHYDNASSTIPSPSIIPFPSTSPFETKDFTPSDLRKVKPGDPLQVTAWYADGHFNKMIRQTHQNQLPQFKNSRIKSIKAIRNSKLEAAFESKRKEFLTQNIPADPIFAYHGTQNDQGTLEYARRQVHGPGNYFSEYPDVSLGYGSGLIFCQLLLGNEYSGTDMSWPGYDSKV